ncbi:hypothetical protein NPIL_501191, partial [Nephila pilipes]
MLQGQSYVMTMLSVEEALAVRAAQWDIMSRINTSTDSSGEEMDYECAIAGSSNLQTSWPSKLTFTTTSPLPRRSGFHLTGSQ